MKWSEGGRAEGQGDNKKEGGGLRDNEKKWGLGSQQTRRENEGGVEVQEEKNKMRGKEE